MLVPLIGLGSDQVEKATIPEHNVHAYHCDEHKFEDAIKLRSFLLGLSEEEAKFILIVLYMSPQSFSDRNITNPQTNQTTTRKSGWYDLIEVLGTRGHLSLICIDEVHTIHQSGRIF